MLGLRLFVLAACLVASPAWSAACAPPKLVKIVARLVTPGVPDTAFARKPKTTYRQGDRLVRVEEAPDTAQRLHLMIVVNEPDIWTVNWADGSGRHVVDPGPSFYATAPILTRADVPPEFADLGFGCEADFIRAHAPKAERGRTVAGRPAEAHVLTEGPHRLEVLFDGARRPLEVSYQRDGRPLFVIHYDAYESGLAARPDLFVRPEGVTYSEGDSGRR